MSDGDVKLLVSYREDYQRYMLTMNDGPYQFMKLIDGYDEVQSAITQGSEALRKLKHDKPQPA